MIPAAVRSAHRPGRDHHSDAGVGAQRVAHGERRVASRGEGRAVFADTGRAGRDLGRGAEFLGTRCLLPAIPAIYGT
jgi:hypothetical protein